MKYFNALKSFDELKAAGVPDAQARVMINIVGDSLGASMTDVATKNDLAEFKAATKADISELKAATKADIGELKAATKADIGELKAELKTETGALRIDLEKLVVSVGWMQKLFFASTFLILIDVARGFFYHV